MPTMLGNLHISCEPCAPELSLDCFRKDLINLCLVRIHAHAHNFHDNKQFCSFKIAGSPYISKVLPTC